MTELHAIILQLLRQQLVPPAGCRFGQPSSAGGVNYINLHRAEQFLCQLVVRADLVWFNTIGSTTVAYHHAQFHLADPQLLQQLQQHLNHRIVPCLPPASSP